MSDARSAVHRIAMVVVLFVGLFALRRALAEDRPAPDPAAPAGVEAVPAKPEPQPNVGGKKDEKPQSLLELIVKGGWVMIPIGLCSVVAVAVAIERGLSLRRKKIVPPDFLGGLKDVLQSTNHNVDAGIRYCDERQSTISNIFKAGFARMFKGEEAMEAAIEEAGSREVYKMKRSLRPLAVVANISPLLGLLGTVYGMISAFQAASTMGVGRGDALAVGIYEALVTTAAGLTIAIPVLIVYQAFSSKIDSIVDDIDEQAIGLLEYAVYSKQRNKTAGS